MAAGESYRTKLLRFWAPSGWTALWLVFGLAPLFFFETFVHEGLHWVTGTAGGDDPTLIPYPHFNTDIGGGRTVNGATLDGIGFPGMPQFVGLGLIVVLSVVFVCTSPPWGWVRFLLTWWYLGLVLDVLFNTISGLFGPPRPGTDWRKFYDEHDVLAPIFSWVILLTVLSHFVWIQWSRWNVNRPRGLGFFEFRPAAVAFGLLSLIALVVSFTVTHESVVRNGLFWLVVVWHAVSLGWFAGYFAWATARRGRGSARSAPLPARS